MFTEESEKEEARCRASLKGAVYARLGLWPQDFGDV